MTTDPKMNSRLDYDGPEKITGILCPGCYGRQATVVEEDPRFPTFKCPNHPDIIYDRYLGFAQYITNNHK